jgi:signal-transduction protein with cAMP-binding, CBS, and nucleotidyltransferase domain
MLAWEAARQVMAAARPQTARTAEDTALDDEHALSGLDVLTDIPPTDAGAPQGRTTTMNATVKDIMTTHVVAVGKRASFKDIAANLGRFRVSAFPVVDENGAVIGVISETDLIAKQASDLAREALAEGHGGVAATTIGSLRQEPHQADGLTAATWSGSSAEQTSCRSLTAPMTRSATKSPIG